LTGASNRRKLLIPVQSLVAVQLCPWHHRVGSGETTLAVQGLIVIERIEGSGYERLPILVTGDFVGAARLMRRLSEVLQVPYLFGADAAVWKAEFSRAQSRPPLKSGGWQT
jgi:hypothetical protein